MTALSSERTSADVARKRLHSTAVPSTLMFWPSRQGGRVMGTTLKRWFRAVPVVAMAIATQLEGAGAASSGTLDKIRTDQAIRIAYRDDARPFSYKESDSVEPAGYMVNLCRAVAKKLADQLGVPSL